MTVWTVHAPPSPGISDEPAEDVVLIKEGLSWTALIFAPIWTLMHRLWLTFAIWLMATIAISLLGSRWGDAVGWPLWIGFIVWFAMEAGDFRRAKLQRLDWRLVDVVEARTAKLAERRYFEKLAEARAGDISDYTRAPITLAPPRPGSFPPVIGFPSGDRL